MSLFSSHQEQIAAHYILSDTTLRKVTSPKFFSNKIVSDIYAIAREHAEKYDKPPTKEQVIELVKMKGYEEEISEDTINAFYNAQNLLKQYDEDWLDKNVKPWIEVRNLETVMRKSIAYMKTTKITPENASEVVENIRHMMAAETAIDFSFDLGKDFFDPKNHKQSLLERVSTGYDYLDLCLKGGWWKGSLISFIASPKGGKSLWLQNMANKSVLNGHNTAYITLELQEPIVNMRIGSNMFNIPFSDYETKSEDEDFMRDRMNKVRSGMLNDPGYLYVKEFPSSTLSANDLKAHLIKAEEILGLKFKHVYIDYINIMKNWRNPNSENTYIKIKQIAEDLRAAAQYGNWTFISVSQTGRCLSPNTIVYNKEKGKVELKYVNEGDYILGDKSYKKVKNIFTNKNTKTYKIKTKSGKEIIASANHTFPVNNSLKQVSDMKLGDKLNVKNNFK